MQTSTTLNVPEGTTLPVAVMAIYAGVFQGNEAAGNVVALNVIVVVALPE